MWSLLSFESPMQVHLVQPSMSSILARGCAALWSQLVGACFAG